MKIWQWSNLTAYRLINGLLDDPTIFQQPMIFKRESSYVSVIRMRFIIFKKGQFAGNIKMAGSMIFNRVIL
ncbi:hypothetical protein [Listeria costaricensis]|uniref:hypothetical protein n=1 Tax=Listeria costaricensis TaxID=2026604 RepID=UPI000C068F2C|nr:hypothetical protein [Listeria costaricensis]